MARMSKKEKELHLLLNPKKVGPVDPAKLKATKVKRLNRSTGGDVLIAVILGVFGLFMLFPIVFAVSNAFKPLDELWYFPPRLIVRNPTMKNFIDLFNLMSESWVPFSKYIFNTLLVAVTGTFGHVIIASLAAFAISKHKFRGQKVMFQMIVLSLMFSGAVTGVPTFLIFSRLGMMNNFLVLILPAFTSSLGLYLMKQFMDQMINESVLEAAKIDGSNEFNTFWKIVMPMVKPAWLTLIVLSFQGLWNTGGTVYIQKESLKTLNYALGQILAAGVTRQGAAAAAAVIMMILPVLVFVFSQSKIVETMSSSGMKD
ncbi:MAG: carbohydrate ABC transporter permease [Oscillospiraceae bacterium]|nr:carbohydrate ABC transporter permease [Oscillospiraceae bacterium]